LARLPLIAGAPGVPRVTPTKTPPLAAGSGSVRVQEEEPRGLAQNPSGRHALAADSHAGILSSASVGSRST
jgi:hypothetical protein